MLAIVIGISNFLFNTDLISLSAEPVAFKIFLSVFVELSPSAKVFKEFTLIVLENMLYVILISSAVYAFGVLKNNVEITKIKNILDIKNILNLSYIFAPAAILTSLTTPFSVTFFAIFIPISFV